MADVGEVDAAKASTVRGGGQFAGLARVAAAPGVPNLAGLGVVLHGHRVAQGLEGVEAVAVPYLGGEGVDDALGQALAFVGELEAVRCRALGDDAEGFSDRFNGVARVAHP